MASCNLQIDNGVVNDDLNCVKCKSIPNDPCLVPCGCRLCRICINGLLATGVQFCPGLSEECKDSLLSQSVTDYRANKNILKLPIKCSNNGCVHACQLTNMEEHLRVCPRKSVECPFRELGCTQDRLAAEEMSDHLQRESLSHSEILIGMINNVNNEMEGSKKEIEMLKKTEGINNRKIEELKKIDKSKQREIDILKKTNVDYKKEIENNKNMIDKLKFQLEFKDGQIKSIMEDIKSMKKANDECTDLMKTSISETRHEIDKLRNNSNAELTEYVDKGISAIKTDIESINQGTKSIKDDIDCMKSQVQLIQVPTADSLVDTVLDRFVSALEKCKGEHNASEIRDKNNILIRTMPPQPTLKSLQSDRRLVAHGKSITRSDSPYPFLGSRASTGNESNVTDLHGLLCNRRSLDSGTLNLKNQNSHRPTKDGLHDTEDSLSF